mmetsp:Transcript_112926/g.315508  ORF Transcript_112926/g.315508 Transcript_112926/m.315508 type:complete len:273 (-) Transcript_112926:19-837(-)
MTALRPTARGPAKCASALCARARVRGPSARRKRTQGQTRGPALFACRDAQDQHSRSSHRDDHLPDGSPRLERRLRVPRGLEGEALELRRPQLAGEHPLADLADVLRHEVVLVCEEAEVEAEHGLGLQRQEHGVEGGHAGHVRAHAQPRPGRQHPQPAVHLRQVRVEAVDDQAPVAAEQVVGLRQRGHAVGVEDRAVPLGRRAPRLGDPVRGRLVDDDVGPALGDLAGGADDADDAQAPQAQDLAEHVPDAARRRVHEARLAIADGLRGPQAG